MKVVQQKSMLYRVAIISSWREKTNPDLCQSFRNYILIGFYWINSGFFFFFSNFASSPWASFLDTLWLSFPIYKIAPISWTYCKHIYANTHKTLRTYKHQINIPIIITIKTDKTGVKSVNCNDSFFQERLKRIFLGKHYS